jgi:ribosomal-protein-alanine N-acetyltransferase
MNLDGLPYAVGRMQPQDVLTVSAIEHDVFTLPWSTAAFRHEVGHNSFSQYLVLRYVPWMPASQGGRWPIMQRLIGNEHHDPSILGYGGFWMMGHEAHVCTLALRPEWRGRGLGELLLASLIERAYFHNLSTVSLEVRVTNAVAQNLYRKYDFAPAGLKKRYYTDNGEDALNMVIDDIMSPGYRAHFDELSQHLRQRLLAGAKAPPERSVPR